MAGNPFNLGLIRSFVVLLWLMSRVSGESEPSLDGKEDDESSKQRYNTLLDEIEKRYSGLMLPRMIGKVGEVQEVRLVDGRNVTVNKLSQKPPIYEVKKFLTDDECNRLIELANEYGLKESQTLDESEETDTERLLEMNKFDMWDKDNSGSIEVTEVQHVFEQLLDFDSEEMDLIDMIGDLKLDANRDGVISMEEFTDYKLTRPSALEFIRRVNKIKAEKPTTKGRFSEQTFLSDFQDPILQKLRERLSALAGFPKDLVDASEDLQVVKYSPGGHYNCHLDSEKIERGMEKCCHLGEFAGPDDSQCQLCRYMTGLYFLNDVEEGGETAFPLADNITFSQKTWMEDSDGLCNLARNCHKSNVVVKPEKGKAVLWYNHLIRRKSGWLGQVDFRSFHGGCNVQKGVKWIANNWINASPNRKEDFRLWASEKLNKELKMRQEESIVSPDNLHSVDSEIRRDTGYSHDDNVVSQSYSSDTRDEL